MTLTEKAKAVFATDRYATELTGIVIDNVETHAATCSLTLDECHRNARNVVMGGVLFTLADFCTAVAANSDTLDELYWVSLDSNIHFLAPATGERLTARCSALKVGRTTALYQTIIDSLDKGTPVAIVETCMIRA